MQIDIPGGTAVIRDRITVGIEKQLRAVNSDVREAINDALRARGPQEMHIPGPLPDPKPDDEKASPIIIRQNPAMMAAIEEVQTVGVVTLTESWSLPAPLPQTVEEWDASELTEAYNALAVATTPLVYKIITGASFAPNPEKPGDPETPTVLSSDSNGGEPEAQTP